MMEGITRQIVADTLAAYLKHELAFAALVTLTETVLMKSDFEHQHFQEIRDAVASLGVGDVRAFGLTWEDCEPLLQQLGYSAHIHTEAN